MKRYSFAILVTIFVVGFCAYTIWNAPEPHLPAGYRIEKSNDGYYRWCDHQYCSVFAEKSRFAAIDAAIAFKNHNNNARKWETEVEK